MKALVLGNGNNDPIVDADYDNVFAANSSFIRIQNSSLTTTLVLSESLLWNKEKLITLPKVNSQRKQDSESSLEIRLSKQEAIRNAVIEELVVFKIDSKVNELDIRKSLKDLNITVSKLTLLSHRDRLLLLLRTLNIFEILVKLIQKDIFLIPGFLAGLIRASLGGKIPLKYRPSTGILCIMLALSEKKLTTLEISGIGEREGKGSFYNNRYVENDSFHILDKLYLNLIMQKYPNLFQ